MAENTNIHVKVAMALLQEVEEKVKETLGDQIALPFAPGDNDFELQFFCEEMVKQCKLAEKKAPESRDVLVLSNILQAQLYGCCKKGTSMAGVYNKAEKAYEKALELGGNEALLRYRMAIFFRVLNKKDKAVENFQRVIDLVGEDSEMGIECAKELEKEKAKSGCFIATAACGTPLAEEVIWLSRFRDDVLAKRAMGVNFINFYYQVSPSIAARVSRSSLAKAVIRSLIVRPLSKFARLFTN